MKPPTELEEAVTRAVCLGNYRAEQIALCVGQDLKRIRRAIAGAIKKRLIMDEGTLILPFNAARAAWFICQRRDFALEEAERLQEQAAARISRARRLDAELCELLPDIEPDWQKQLELQSLWGESHD